MRQQTIINLLRDVAGVFPVAGRLHPDDVFALQNRIVHTLQALESDAKLEHPADRFILRWEQDGREMEFSTPRLADIPSRRILAKLGQFRNVFHTTSRLIAHLDDKLQFSAFDPVDYPEFAVGAID
jgi:hypothetical protein